MAKNTSTTLTARQLEVVRLVAAGMKNGEIASRLAITPETVRGHIKSIQQHTGTKGRDQIVDYAHAHGLIETEVAL